MSLLQNMLFDPYGTSIFHQLDDSGDDSIRMDWKETEAAHVLKADLPGFKKEDVKVEVEDGGVISITAKRPRDEKGEEEEECTWHCSERSRDGLLRRRRFRLPEDAKAEETKASMENGVLTLVVPKVEVKKPHVRSVEIEGGDGKKKKRSEKGKKNKGDAVCCTFWHR